MIIGYYSFPYDLYHSLHSHSSVLLWSGFLLVILPILVVIVNIIGIFDVLVDKLKLSIQSTSVKSLITLILGFFCLLFYWLNPYQTYSWLFSIGLLSVLVITPGYYLGPVIIKKIRQNTQRTNHILLAIVIIIVLLLSTLSMIMTYLEYRETHQYQFQDITVEQQSTRFNLISGTGSSFFQFNIDQLIASYGITQSEYYIGSYLLATTYVDRFKYGGDPIEINKQAQVFRIETKLRSNKISYNPFGASYTAELTISLVQHISGSITFSITVEPEQTYSQPINRIQLSFLSPVYEQIYGLGIQYSDINLKGQRVPIWVSEQGHGRGEQPTTTLVNIVSYPAAGDRTNSYAPMPHFVSNLNRSLTLSTDAYSEFDFRKSQSATIEVWDNSMSGTIRYDQTVKELTAAFSQDQGIMPAMPDWMGQGAIVRTRGGGSDAVRDLVDLYQNKGINIAGVWIEDWAGVRQTEIGTRLWWNWVPDETLYPDWEQLVDELRAEDIQVLTYYNSFLTDASQKDGVTRNLYQEAVEGNYLIKNQQGKDYIIEAGGFDAGMLDFTNPATVDWMQALMKQQLDIGVSGWMADFAEYVPPDAKLYSGEGPLVYHNTYPVDWARVNAEVTQNHVRSHETMFFMRSAYLGSHQLVPAMWLGDQLVNWGQHDGIKSAAIGLQNSGYAGLPQMHMDIGGYFSIINPAYNIKRTEELLKRWMELAAFSMAFRTHEGNQPDDNLQVWSNDNLLNHFVHTTKIFTALNFYRQQLLDFYRARGVPVIRPMHMEFPEYQDRDTLLFQFMYGDELLIHPIVEAGQSNVEVFVPEGDWINIWTNEVLSSDGDWFEIEAQLGHPVILYPDESVVGSGLRSNFQSEGLLD